MRRTDRATAASDRATAVSEPDPPTGRGRADAIRARLTPLWSRGWPVLLLGVVVVAVWSRPVLGDFNSVRLANPGDSGSFEFYLGWNVHAVLHAQNPFFTPNMYAPRGLDLGNAISVPAVSLLLAPVTVLVGTTAAYNTGVLLAVFLAALSTYLLARELTGRTAGSVAAGALMVLNPYFTGHVQGHFNLLWIFGLPLVAFFFVRHLHGKLGRAALVGGTAVVVAFTLGASTELAVIETLFGGVGLVVTLLLAGSSERRDVVRAAAWTALGVGIGALLATPVILASLRSGVPSQPANPPGLYSSDLMNVFAPSEVFLFGGGQAWSADWLGNRAENTAYLPITLLLLVAGVLLVRRTRLSVALVVFSGLSLLCSFGPALVVDGTPHLWMPWQLTEHIPGLDHALPARFSMFVYLPLCLLVATIWPTLRAARAVASVALITTLAMLLPDFGPALIPVKVPDREFVLSGDYRQVIKRDEIVLVMPGGQHGPGLQWVTDADFFFRLPTGNGGGASLPPDLEDPLSLALYGQVREFDYGPLPGWARARHVSVVLVRETSRFHSAVARDAFGPPDRTLDGVQVWRLDGETAS